MSDTSQGLLAIATSLFSKCDTAIQVLKDYPAPWNKKFTDPGGYDERIAAKESLIDGFVAGARSENPYYRVLPNQRLLDITTDGLIGGWSSHSLSGPVEVVETVNSGTNPDSRDAEAQALLTAMTGANQQYVSHSFKILKLTLSKSAEQAYATAPGIHYPLNNWVTDGAWVKILSGDIRGGWATGADIDAGWKLCGRVLGPMKSTRYTGNHPRIYSDNCEILIALPTTVMGRFDLSTDSWGIFPYIAGENGVGE